MTRLFRDLGRQDRLINRHGRRDGDKRSDCYWADEVAKVVIHNNPDGKYLIKGGGSEVWKHFRLRRDHRRLQGIIHGKRCGTTENIGSAARGRWQYVSQGVGRKPRLIQRITPTPNHAKSQATATITKSTVNSRKRPKPHWFQLA